MVLDLVEPMPKTSRGKKGILVLTHYCTKWQGALALLEATTLIVPNALDERVFRYMDLPEQIPTNQRAV